MTSKIALITGSSKGLGKAIAVELAKRGYLVVINCKESFGEATLTKKEIRDLGYKADVLVGDITKKSKCQELIKKIVRKYGGIDVLINNAGIFKKQDEMREVDEIKFFKTKISAVINLSDEAIKNKVKSIVNISSVYAISPSFDSRFASAIQSSVITLTKAYAKKFLNKVQVNTICPGWMETTMVTSNYDGGVLRKVLKEKIPINRLIRPEEIATFVPVLVDYPLLTGQTFIFDGGVSFRKLNRKPFNY